MKRRKTPGTATRTIVQQYPEPIEVPTSYGMDEYPWTEEGIRDMYVRECGGDHETARTVREMLALGLWFEMVGDTVVLMGNAGKASDDLYRRMHDCRVGIRRWYLENVHSATQAA